MDQSTANVFISLTPKVGLRGALLSCQDYGYPL